MRLATCHLTSPGGRRENQDAVKEVAGDGFTLLALADGLGGHGDGALAAGCCVETVAQSFSHKPGLSDDLLLAVVDDADQAVAQLRLVQQKAASSMLTTLALLAVCGNLARWAHAGDSRVYWFRDKMLMHRTRDHSVAELVAGLQDRSLAAPHDDADRARLLRVVGTGSGARANLSDSAVSLRPGDAFLLCSDGTWNLVSDPDITGCLSDAATPQDWCGAIERRLKQQLGQGIHENNDDYSLITAMVVP